MNMSGLRAVELRHLQALQAVARAGTFGRAAERLGYTQSAVSQQIAALERIVGAPVFDRPGGPRPVELTPLGSLLLRHVDDLLARLDAAAAEIERFQAGEVGRLVVGTFQSVSVEVLPRVIGLLRAERPELEIRLYEADLNDELLAGVADGELDCSFVVGVPDDPALEAEVLGHDPFVAVAPRDGGTGPLPLQALGSTALIGQPATSCQGLVDHGLRANGIEPSYVFRTADNGAVQAMVRAGMGVAVLPLLAVDLTDERVAVRPLDPPIPDRVIALARRAGRTPSPATLRFLELAHEVCSTLDERRTRVLGPAPRRRRAPAPA
jgi:DNA-binding transcriptional LysR family regulator